MTSNIMENGAIKTLDNKNGFFLIEARIAGFGNLSNVVIKFNNLTALCYGNGWGKTTLAAFIKVMFYGFEYTRGKKLSERERFRPWGGESFGGSIIFRKDGNTYRVTRTFGENSKKDKFALFNEMTGGVSHDFLKDVFPADNIGEGLFGVGCDTFERTVFITLNKEKRASATADISARLNNLIQDHDMGDFDKAVATLNGEKRKLSSKAKGEREIPYFKEVISKCLIDISEAKSALERLPHLLDKEGALQAAITKKQEEREEINNTFLESERAIKYKQYMGLKDSAKDAADKCREYESALKKYSDDNNNIATMADIEKKQKALDYYIRLRADIAQKRLTQEEEDELKRLEGVPNITSALDENIRKAKDYLSDMAALDKDAQILEGKIRALQSDIVKELSKKNGEPRLKKVFIAVGAVIFAASVATGLFFIGTAVRRNGENLVTGAPLVAAVFGVVIAVIIFIIAVFIKGNNSGAGEKTNELRDLQEKSEEVTTSINDNIKRLEELGVLLLDSSIDRSRYNSQVMESAFLRFQEKRYRYKELDEKKEDYLKWLSSRPRSIKECEDFIGEFVTRWGGSDFGADSVRDGEKGDGDECGAVSGEDLISAAMGLLDEAKRAAIEYGFQKEASRSAKKALSDFIAENDSLLKDFDNGGNEGLQGGETDNGAEDGLHKEKSAANMKALLSNITAQCDILTRELCDNKNEQKTVREKAALIDRAEEKKRKAQEILTQKNKRLFILEKAIELLEESKRELEAAYIDPLKNSFDQYIKKFGTALNISITSALDVKVEGGNLFHCDDYLSAGEGDIANIASRLALVDCLYKKGKPPIILDDPFSNLDEKTIEFAKRVIKVLSRDTQVIYFTCHKARSI